MGSLSEVEDDNFFSKLELDEIIALEQSALHPPKNASKEMKGMGAMSLKLGMDNRNHHKKTSSFISEAPKGNPRKKQFTFKAPFPKQPQPPSVTSSSSLRYGREPAGTSISTGAGTGNELPLPAVVGNNIGSGVTVSTVQESPKDTASVKWKNFVQRLRSRSRFDTPWFKTIPVTALNLSQWKTLVAVVKTDNVVPLANMMFGILMELNGMHESLDSSVAENYQDLLKLLEEIVRRIEKDLLLHTRAQRIEANQLCTGMWQIYAKGKLDFATTKIPEILTRLHPEGLEEIFRSSRNSGSVDLLVPLCAQSSEIFLGVISRLNSENITSSGGGSSYLNEDVDFQDFTTDPAKFGSELICAIKTQLGIPSFMKLVPTKFQSLLSFEYAATAMNPNLLRDPAVLEEIFNIFNVIFTDCYDCERKVGFAVFMMSMSSSIWQLINHDKKISKSVKFRRWPYLWKVLRRK